MDLKKKDDPLEIEIRTQCNAKDSWKRKKPLEMIVPPPPPVTNVRPSVVVQTGNRGFLLVSKDIITHGLKSFVISRSR